MRQIGSHFVAGGFISWLSLNWAGALWFTAARSFFSCTLEYKRSWLQTASSRVFSGNGQVGTTNNPGSTGCSRPFCQMVQPSPDMLQLPENLIYLSVCTCAEGWRVCANATECKGACEQGFTCWPVLCTYMRSKKANEAHRLGYRYKTVRYLIFHSWGWLGDWGKNGVETLKMWKIIYVSLCFIF